MPRRRRHHRARGREDVRLHPVHAALQRHRAAGGSVPLPGTRTGLPIGMQFGQARLGDDATPLRIAAQPEQVRPWFDRRPPGSDCDAAPAGLLLRVAMRCCGGHACADDAGQRRACTSCRSCCRRCRPTSASRRRRASLPYTLLMIGFGIGGMLMGRLRRPFRRERAAVSSARPAQSRSRCGGDVEQHLAVRARARPADRPGRPRRRSRR